VPVSKRTTDQYARVYRSINHGPLRHLCKEIRSKAVVFGSDIRDFAATLSDLQEKRHSADYDPLFKVLRSDTILAISAARTAIGKFQAAPAEEQANFLSLLLFPAKR
jgi:hypothetical protein